MKWFFNWLFGLVSAAVGVWVSLAPEARAAVDTVTTTADSGPGSLRDTIAAAASGDTINFAPGLSGQTIYLTSGELFIGQNLTIDASAGILPPIAIDGGNNSRVMEIGSGSSVNLNTIAVTNGYVSDDSGGGVLLDDPTSSLTATNCAFCSNSGSYGGAIACFGTVTLNNCSVTRNSASIFGGGIYGYAGGITLNNCTLSENSVANGGGGGIDSEFCTLALNNCTVSSNDATAFGGGIYAEDESQGSLALTNCVFLGNSSETGGAISAETPATLNGCTFSNNISGTGGAIVNYDIMTLCNCTLSGNTVTNNGVGGGMANSGTLTMNNCTVSGNAAVNGYGGGVYNPGALTANYCTWSSNTAANNAGGGICNGGILTLNDCTLSGNCATNGIGGGLFTQGVSTNILVNCTVCSNSAAEGFGGGIYNEGIALLTNTIVAANAASAEADVHGSYSGVANFIGGNPQLACLGNYGGTTQTMPPTPGSPVIDAGTDWVTNFLATDQRGYQRLAGEHVDIGAVESRNFVVLNANDSGDDSLRAILTNSPDFVTFTNTLSGQTIHLTSGELVVSNITTIDASMLPGGIKIDGGGVSRVFQINDVNVILNSLTVTNGNAGNGGGIENGGTITLNHCIVSGNTAPYSGGGIDYRYHAATLIDCNVSGNSSGNGGGFYCYASTLILNNSIVSNNSAIDGGGIDCGDATVTLNNCNFTGNSARNIGGGINGGGLQGGTLEATNCTFTCESANEGGAMEWGGLGTMDHCTISTNTAQYGAAGILNDYGTLTLCNSTMAGNTAGSGEGGAISSGAFLTANNCTFLNNIGTNAGAIANSFGMTINNCMFMSNSATLGNGGAIYNYRILNVTNSTFSLNTATNGQGGGIYNWHTLTLDTCSLEQNTATNGGGIADAYSGDGSILTANNCTLFSNIATSGGAIFNVVSMTLNNCTLWSNLGIESGGAICSQSADAAYRYYPTNSLNNCTIFRNVVAFGSGGGVSDDNTGTLALTNTIVAENTAASGADVSGVYFGVANFIGGDPQLASALFAPYGGTTDTFPPMFGSPVIDAGTDWVTNFLSTDQRGFPRLSGKHVDIGAVEAQTAPANCRPILNDPTRLGPPGANPSQSPFQFIFTSVSNADFTVLFSTNLALPLDQWMAIGNAFQYFPGEFEFDDTAATNNTRFYKVVSP
ncbi:MAG TPA: choice-of-anchor Q domain-containing protein [Verrucomicrobiae bacterium]|jgi:predicted outer membrane repeat protein|nr:choice-of-anchor Q domain-containing protein [Verrucomicrobiae bacterium]